MVSPAILTLIDFKEPVKISATFLLHVVLGKG